MSDDFFDLIVWYDPNGEIHGFQLCYDKGGRERALTWTRGNDGCAHTSIDTGEAGPTANRTPVLGDDQHFADDLVRGEFAVRGSALPMDIRTLVLGHIDGYVLRGR